MPRFFYVTLDDGGVHSLPSEEVQPGKYLVIDTGASGLPQEADVIATTTDQVHARDLVAAMEAGLSRSPRTALVGFEHDPSGIVARCVLCGDIADPVTQPAWHGQHIRAQHPEFVTWELKPIPEFDETAGR